MKLRPNCTIQVKRTKEDPVDTRYKIDMRKCRTKQDYTRIYRTIQNYKEHRNDVEDHAKSNRRQFMTKQESTRI